MTSGEVIRIHKIGDFLQTEKEKHTRSRSICEGDAVPSEGRISVSGVEDCLSGEAASSAGAGPECGNSAKRWQCTTEQPLRDRVCFLLKVSFA